MSSTKARKSWLAIVLLSWSITSIAVEASTIDVMGISFCATGGGVSYAGSTEDRIVFAGSLCPDQQDILLDGNTVKIQADGLYRATFQVMDDRLRPLWIRTRDFATFESPTGPIRYRGGAGFFLDGKLARGWASKSEPLELPDLPGWPIRQFQFHCPVSIRVGDYCPAHSDNSYLSYVTTTSPVEVSTEIGSLEVPASEKIEFSRQGVRKITLQRTQAVMIGGSLARAKGEIHWHDNGTLKTITLADGQFIDVDFHGRQLKFGGTLAWSQDGKLIRGVLATEEVFRSHGAWITLRAGKQATFWPNGTPRSVSLNGLHNLNLGEVSLELAGWIKLDEMGRIHFASLPYAQEAELYGRRYRIKFEIKYSYEENRVLGTSLSDTHEIETKWGPAKYRGWTNFRRDGTPKHLFFREKTILGAPVIAAEQCEVSLTSANVFFGDNDELEFHIGRAPSQATVCIPQLGSNSWLTYSFSELNVKMTADYRLLELSDGWHGANPPPLRASVFRQEILLDARACVAFHPNGYVKTATLLESAVLVTAEVGSRTVQAGERVSFNEQGRLLEFARWRDCYSPRRLGEVPKK